ncbi:MAG TPA: ATP-binding cassette domain-containing protein [Ktedonobacterales bacterium]|jgi:energy-coupling factor transport system ATP-binding protein|nr:ATP-binding cassette domain-containing protein [Ktedonobacterales bacterium]
MPPLIEVERATYVYPARYGTAPSAPALDAVSLRIAPGEYVALLGHNGSGKSTLARLLNGLLVPAAGHVRVLGHDTHDRARRQFVRERVGMIFSDPDSQIIATVVADDVAWGLAARGLPREAIASRVDAALAAVGLADARGQTPQELSGGQRQRLAIAGVLALEPACIVADEVTAQLDPRARGEILALLREVNRIRGLSVVAVTHLLEEAALADRVIVLEQGRIALEGSPAAVFADLDRLRALRLVVPEIALLGERLRRAGLAIPPDALTPEALVAALIETEGRPA